MKIIELVFKEQSIIIETNGVINKIGFNAANKHQELMANEQIGAILSILNLA
ncbi:hypothetical protein [Fangia hongkongensis]|uniref:hypothetical protein n=1 Tax=Fangia hongkongensis TaxID=270495 RepID=UPI0003607058|nr:hypothetical protein [Fangia hongkongensis]MBK2124721.1 hypothetical protein [Fangia hongkongensis]